MNNAIRNDRPGKGKVANLRLWSEGGRRPSGIGWASNTSFDERAEQATPLTNIKKNYEFSHYLGSHRRKRDKGKKNASEQATQEVQGRPHTPEERIKLFAFRLAFIEKAASWVGTLAFLWATVVILGGFATSLTFPDFWVAAVIIFAEALRIFTRSHELEWQMLKPKKDKKPKPKEDERSTRGDPGRSAPSPSSSVHGNSPSNHVDNYDAPSPSVRNLFSFNEFSKPSKSGGKQSEEVQRSSETQTGPVHESEAQTSRTMSKSHISIISPSVPVLSYLLKPQVMSRLLYIVSMLSAVVCIVLSIWRLLVQDFCFIDDDKDELICNGYHHSLVVSMNLFYSMAILEAALFLIEKGYFEYRMRYKQLLSKVQKEVLGGRMDHSVFEKFYYTVYTTCLKGSIFEGLDMSLVKFAIQWLQSDNFEEQLHGAKLLRGFISEIDEDNYKQDCENSKALRRLGTTPGIMERLVEMLSWNSKCEEELIEEIAAVVCGLVARGHYGSRFAAVPGSLQAVLYLLMPDSDDSKGDGRVLKIRLTGLKILRHLCTSYADSLEIGETRGLLPILVFFIQVRGSNAPRHAENHEEKLKIYERSLQVLYFLAANKSTSGVALRKRIAGIVSVLKNLRDIIEDYSNQPELQLLSMKVLHQLALAEDMRCSIGATGGTIRLLFNIFAQNDAVRESNSETVANALKNAMSVLESGQPDQVVSAVDNAVSKVSEEDIDQERMVAIKLSGTVLSRLMLQNKDNCSTLLMLKDQYGNKPFVDVMISSLFYGDKDIAASAADILRSVLMYADESAKTKIAERSAPKLLQNISNNITADTRSVMYEGSLGLASRALESLSEAKYREALSQQVVLGNRESLAHRLVANLLHSPTTDKVPKIRRYSIEMIIALVRRDEYFRAAFVKLDLNTKLERALESISEVENFILLSGLTGCARHSEDMKPLLLRCIAAFNDSLSSVPTSHS